MKRFRLTENCRKRVKMYRFKYFIVKYGLSTRALIYKYHDVKICGQGINKYRNIYDSPSVFRGDLLGDKLMSVGCDKRVSSEREGV